MEQKQADNVNEPRHDVSESAAAEDTLDTRHRALVDAIAKRTRIMSEQDAFEAVGRDAFAYLDKIDGAGNPDCGDADGGQDGGETLSAGKTRKIPKFVPPVDAGMYSAAAGSPGGLFDSIQADASASVTPDRIRYALRRRLSEPENAPDEAPPEPPSEEDVRARVLRDKIRGDRYIDVARTERGMTIDKSSFPAFKSALGLAFDEDVIPDAEDVPDIMRTATFEEDFDEPEPQDEPELLPELFSGIGRQYTLFESRPWEEPPKKEEPVPQEIEEDEPVDSGELLDMLARCELEHERKVEQLEDSARRSRTQRYDPYNSAFNARGMTSTDPASIPSMMLPPGYAMSTEHHVPEPENGSPKRRRQRRRRG